MNTFIKQLAEQELKRRQKELLGKIGFLDVLKEIPTGIKKTGEGIVKGLQSIGQSSMRAYAGIGGAITGKTLTPETQFQKELYGTDQPITLRKVGAETGLSEKSKLAPIVGFALGASDLIPGGKVTKNSAIALLKSVNKADDALKILTKTMGVSSKVASKYAPEAAKLTNTKSLSTLVDKVVGESQEVKEVAKRVVKFSKDLVEATPKIEQAKSTLKAKLPTKPLSPQSLSKIPNDVSSFYNVDKLNIDDSAKQTIKNVIFESGDYLNKTVGAKLTNQEVLDLAGSTSRIVSKAVSREQTAEKIASTLRLRQAVAKSAQSGKIDENFVKLWIRDKSIGEDIARQLQARRITADPIETNFIDMILQSVYKVNKNADEIAEEAKNVDFNDLKQVTEFYRKFVKPKASEWIDLLRYNSMLTSPNTHIINTASNFEGTGILAPIEKTLTGILDATRSALTGKPRKYAVGEGLEYAKGFYSNLGKASQNFIDVMKGKKVVAHPDIRQIPLTTKGAKRVVENVLSYPLRLLEGMDRFFMTMTEAGAESALKLREAKGIKYVGESAQSEAMRRVFRSGSENQGYVLNAIDTLTNSIMGLRESSNPIISTIAKFTLPFVRTPTELLKQGIEYSPLGLSTLVGAKNKTEQLSKALIGMASATGVAMLLGQDRLTWAEPINATQKAEFRASGRQPYSIKIGDKWVSYSKLHPALAFNFALISAIDDSLKNQRMSESDADSIMSAFSKTANFIADQSYLKNIGDFVSGIKGEMGGWSRLVSNYPQQLIPFRALSSWLERLTDPYQRQIDPSGGFLEKQMQQVMIQIPGIAQKLPPRLSPLKFPIENQNRVINAFSPNKVTTEEPLYESIYQTKQIQSRTNKMKKDVKDMALKELKIRLGI